MPDSTQPTVDPVAREKLAVRVQNILAITGDDENERYLVGKEFNVIVTECLATAAGYRSVNDFIKTELTGLSRSQLMLYAVVAREFPESTACRLGMTKLGKLLALRTALRLQSLPEPPDEFPVPISKELNENAVKYFKDCSLSDLSRAIRLAKGGEDALPPQAAESVRALQSALDAVLGEDSSAAVKAHVHRDRVHVMIADVPQEDLKEVLTALSQV